MTNPFRDHLGRFARAAGKTMLRGGMPVVSRGKKRGPKKRFPKMIPFYKKRKVTQSRTWLYGSSSARAAGKVISFLFRKRKKELSMNITFKHPGHGNQKVHGHTRGEAVGEAIGGLTGAAVGAIAGGSLTGRHLGLTIGGVAGARVGGGIGRRIGGKFGSKKKFMPVSKTTLRARRRAKIRGGVKAAKRAAQSVGSRFKKSARQKYGKPLGSKPKWAKRKEVNQLAYFKAVSTDAKLMAVREAFREEFNKPSEGSMNQMPYCWPKEVYLDEGYLIAESSGSFYKVNFSKEDGEYEFDEREEWREMEQTYVAKSMPAGMFVFKDADDEYKWVLLSSNGFRDRDGEIVATKALERDVALWELEGRPATPLRFWHISLDDEHTKGLELGNTTFRMVHGHTLIEAGNFIDPVVGEAVFKAQDKLAASIGFRHPPDEPDRDKIFHTIRQFERSLLPKGSASNLLTHLSVV